LFTFFLKKKGKPVVQVCTVQIILEAVRPETTAKFFIETVTTFDAHLHC
jgi:regulator of extracellular matrix RemA (YlzA/DUF370 family)